MKKSYKFYDMKKGRNCRMHCQIYRKIYSFNNKWTVKFYLLKSAKLKTLNAKFSANLLSLKFLLDKKF